MSLKYAILGLIEQGPVHGYEIKKIFSVSFARLWRVSPGQLYPLLRKIVDDGLATKKVKIQIGKPNTHVYRITKKGKQAFQQWLNKPSDELPLVRFELMLKLFFYGQKDAQSSLTEIQQLKSNSEVFIKELEAQHRELKDQIEPCQLLIFEGGIDMAKSIMKWLKKVEETVKKEM